MFWKFLITLKVRACHLRSLFSSKNENQKNSDIYLIPEGDSSKRWCFWRSKSLLESGGYSLKNRKQHIETLRKNKTKKKRKSCKLRPKDASKCDILHLVGLGNLIFIREKSGFWKLMPVATMCSEDVYFEFCQLSYRLEPALQTSYSTSITSFSKITWFHNRRLIIGMMTVWLLITGLTLCRWSIWFDLFTCVLGSRSRMLVLVHMSRISRICRCAA